MKFPSRSSAFPCLICALGLGLATPARALLQMNEGRDQVFVSLSTGITYDSNLYSTSGGEGDYSWVSGVSLEYKRKAGLIGLNATAGWSFSEFAELTSENFSTPSIHLEFTKATGRTTGSLSFYGDRSTRPDINTGTRMEAWNYGSVLNLRYAIIERYSIAGQLSYAATDYTNRSVALVGLDVYSAGADLYYAWTSRRDIFFGYRYRHSSADDGTLSDDHNFSVGVSGKIFSKLNGSVRVGIQTRVQNPATGPEETFSGLSASASATWTVNRRWSLTSTLARDYNTTSTAVTTESTTATVNSQFALNAALSLDGYFTIGANDYVGSGSGSRRDHYYATGLGLSYIVSPHLTVRLSGDYFSNTSTLAMSEFDRKVFTLNLTSRW